MKIAFPLLSLIVTLLFTACFNKEFSQEALLKAIDSGDMSQVEKAVSKDGTYTLVQPVINNQNILDYTTKTQGKKMTELLTTTLLTPKDKQYFLNLHLKSCLKSTAGKQDDIEYCKCTAENFYKDLTYNDIIHKNKNYFSHAKQAMQMCLK